MGHAMQLIPNSINFIWLGSMLRETENYPHQSRLRAWKNANPNHMMRLWFSRTALSSNPVAYQELQEFCADTGILPGDIDALLMKKHVRDFIVQCMQNDSPNWGAVSDLIRFYILREGGWYFDTDIVLTSKETGEIASLPHDNFHLPFGFALNLREPVATSFALSNLDAADFEALKSYDIDDAVLKYSTVDNYTEIEFSVNELHALYAALPEAFPFMDKIVFPGSFYYSPDMIAASMDSAFISKCIAFIEAMVESPQLDGIYQQLHHRDPEKRRLASCYTIAEIAFAACLSIKDKAQQPFIVFDLHASIDDRLNIPNIDSFRSISIHCSCKDLNFQSLDERSYMAQTEIESVEDNSQYIDEILNLFYVSISKPKTRPWFSLFNFWSMESDNQESSISQSMSFK